MESRQVRALSGFGSTSLSAVSNSPAVCLVSLLQEIMYTPNNMQTMQNRIDFNNVIPFYLSEYTKIKKYLFVNFFAVKNVLWMALGLFLIKKKLIRTI